MFVYSPNTKSRESEVIGGETRLTPGEVIEGETRLKRRLPDIVE